MLSWFRRRDEVFKPAWRDTLQANVWQYRHLDPRRRERLHASVARLVGRVEWVGAGGLEMTDEVRVTIAGAASLLTLGLDEPYDFPRLRSLIVYPSAFQTPEAPEEFSLLGGAELNPVGPRLGEAWPRSPIVLSWRHSLRQARTRGRGRNVVLHEFAHHVDGLDGDTDGVPFFERREDRLRWLRVSDREHNRLVGRASRREPTLLDPYGAANHTEFFAVAAECFFERPHRMRREHGELFELLTIVFHQDPTEWLPPEKGHTAAGPNRDREPNPQPAVARRHAAVDLSHLGMDEADEAFTRASLLLDQGHNAEAEELLNLLLPHHPDDGEAVHLRAEARINLGDYTGARADAEAALRLDPEDESAMLTLAYACLALGDEAPAERLVREAGRLGADEVWVLYLRGWLRFRRGDFRSAAERFRRAVAASPYFAEGHYALGLCLRELGEHAAAEQRLQRAQDLAPDLAESPPPL